MNNVILPRKMPLDDMSWQGIRTVADAGMAREYWRPGDTKAIVIDGDVVGVPFRQLKVNAFILGIDHNADLEGRNRIHFGIGMKDGVPVGLRYDFTTYETLPDFRMNLSGTNGGGWKSSHMRTKVLGSDQDPASPAAHTLLAALPRPLRQVMVPVLKYTDNTGNGDADELNITATKEFLWLMAETEIFGRVAFSNHYEQKKQEQYAYFKNHHRWVYKHNDTGTPTDIWCRSPYCNTDVCFCSLTDKRKPGIHNAYFALGVLACFAV